MLLTIWKAPALSVVVLLAAAGTLAGVVFSDKGHSPADGAPVPLLSHT